MTAVKGECMMENLPTSIYSGAFREGHVQGIAIDRVRGYVYYSFTTMRLKTDLGGTPVGSVVRLAGHLGCITYDPERNLIYGSLEMKHDAIGAGIIGRCADTKARARNTISLFFVCVPIRLLIEFFL